MARNRGGWTRRSLVRLEEIKQIVAPLKDYYPLTLRQIYYACVSDLLIDNNLSEYQKLSRLLAKARIDDMFDWEIMEDRARDVHRKSVWDNKGRFLDDIRYFMQNSYNRDLLQSQNVNVEIWIEKDALSSIFTKVAFQYCVPVVVARGFSSVSFVHNCAVRAELAWKNKKQETIILYFGDLDPSGWEMLPSMMETLQIEMNIATIDGVRCALLPEQVEEYKLPKNPNALKLSDSRAEKYMAMFGDLAVELDAVPPQELEKLIRHSIEKTINIESFNDEYDMGEVEQTELEELAERFDTDED